MAATKKRSTAVRGGVASEEGPYQRLRHAIASGVLLPNERLVEANLATSLSVPRAAIRTAIVRLAQEQLVERLPNRGARVRRITEKEAVELLEARIELECLVARHAAMKATSDDVARLNAILSTMEDGLGTDALTYTETNTQLHREIARIADHQTAERLLDDLRSRNTVFQFRTVIFPNEPSVRIQQHRVIVDAIAAHDEAAASEAMRCHLSDVANRMRARLKQERI